MNFVVALYAKPPDNVCTTPTCPTKCPTTTCPTQCPTQCPTEPPCTTEDKCCAKHIKSKGKKKCKRDYNNNPFRQLSFWRDWREPSHPFYNNEMASKMRSTKAYTFLCAGTLIHPRWVVSAASCYHNSTTGEGSTAENLMVI
jgi:hypothetical protein